MRFKLLFMFFYLSVKHCAQKNQVIEIWPDKIGIIGFPAEDMALQCAIVGSMSNGSFSLIKADGK